MDSHPNIPNTPYRFSMCEKWNMPLSSLLSLLDSVSLKMIYLLPWVIIFLNPLNFYAFYWKFFCLYIRHHWYIHTKSNLLTRSSAILIWNFSKLLFYQHFIVWESHITQIVPFSYNFRKISSTTTSNWLIPYFTSLNTYFEFLLNPVRCFFIQFFENFYLVFIHTLFELLQTLPEIMYQFGPHYKKSCWWSNTSWWCFLCHISYALCCQDVSAIPTSFQNSQATIFHEQKVEQVANISDSHPSDHNILDLICPRKRLTQPHF